MTITLITLQDGTIPVAADFNTNWTVLKQAIEAGLDSGTAYAVRGLLGNPGGSPLTQYTVSADQVQLWDPATGARITQSTVSAITVDVSTAGPIINGRDQFGAFTASSWVHLYFIWDGTTLAGIASAAAPTTGPTFPTGYTHWAYIGAIRFNASSQLVATRMRGASAYTQVATVSVNGANPTNNVEQTVDVSAVVPPNALTYTAAVGNGCSSTSGAAFTLSVRVVTTVEHLKWVSSQIANTNIFVGGTVTLPNIGQQFFYLVNGSAGTPTHFVTIVVSGYTMPNGGE